MKTLSEKIQELDIELINEPLSELRSCRICPRNCNADRYSGKLGYCKADASFSVSSICIHRGEEPVISGDKGICNIFFTNCNLQCVFCQNHQISCNDLDYSSQKISIKEILQQIVDILDTGIEHVGFVSPSHFVPQVKAIINGLRGLGLNPFFVYNTNGYDKAETIRSLEKYIDVYLPDFKYAEAELGKMYSDVKDYPTFALEALREMVRQKGTDLQVNDRGYANRGVIIRHLVLPSHPKNSIKVLEIIESEFSNKLHISLMSQYYPTYKAGHHKSIGRTVRLGEYKMVVRELEYLGFENGWVQELSSHDSYRPDFESEKHPFEQ